MSQCHQMGFGSKSIDSHLFLAKMPKMEMRYWKHNSKRSSVNECKWYNCGSMNSWPRVEKSMVSGEIISVFQSLKRIICHCFAKLKADYIMASAGPEDDWSFLRYSLLFFFFSFSLLFLFPLEAYFWFMHLTCIVHHHIRALHPQSHSSCSESHGHFSIDSRVFSRFKALIVNHNTKWSKQM